MQHSPHRQRGITIIEQVIGLAVTGVMLAMGLPNYSDYLQNRHIRTHAESIADGLQLARVEAVRRNEAVDFRINGNDWTIVTAGGETVQSRPGDETPRARVALGGGGSTLDVTFNGLGRIISGNAAATIDVQHVSGGCGASAYRCLRVQMATGGLVRMCDPLLAFGTPQACA